MNAPDRFLTIPDVQSIPDTREIAIDRVGIKGIRHPIQVVNEDGTKQATIAHFCMTVFLPETVKGTHMSRFVEILHQEEWSFDHKTTATMLKTMVQRLGAPAGRIEMSFPLFVTKTAPISGVQSLCDYEVSIIAAFDERIQDTVVQTLKVVVPVTSLCPCSKEISQYGAHNQRSHVTIEARLNASLPVERLIRIAEESASCELYGLLKRPDEKYVTERAYENPMFVEDMIREVAGRLTNLTEIDAFTVESENFESIHNHSAYAMLSRELAR